MRLFRLSQQSQERLAPAADDGTDGAARCTVGVLLVVQQLPVYCLLSGSLVESWAT